MVVRVNTDIGPIYLVSVIKELPVSYIPNCNSCTLISMTVHKHFMLQTKHNLIMDLLLIPPKKIVFYLERTNLEFTTCRWNRSIVILEFYSIEKLRGKDLSSPLTENLGEFAQSSSDKSV